jgi:ribosome biogenesis GTPase A
MLVYQTEKREKYYDQVIEIYRQTGYTPYRIKKMDLVPVGKHTIARWIANFVSENGDKIPIVDMQSNQAQHDEELEALKAKVADLEEQLRIERMRGRLNEKIIEIAEKKYNIPIRKKAGAKQ